MKWEVAFTVSESDSDGGFCPMGGYEDAVTSPEGDGWEPFAAGRGAIALDPRLEDPNAPGPTVTACIWVAWRRPVPGT